MKTTYHFTSEEFHRVVEIINDILGLWNYDIIEANDGEGRSSSMSKETFFKDLKREMNID